MATLHWELRDLLPELRDEGRLNILIAMLLHCNIRLRCYPSVDLLMKETDYARATVSHGKDWLIERGLAVPVPYKLRVDDERKLPVRQSVYQMTGVYTLNGEVFHYLYMTPEAFKELQARILDIKQFKRSISERSTIESSISERSMVEHKGISSIKGISTSKGNAISKGDITPPVGSEGTPAPVTVDAGEGNENPSTVEEKTPGSGESNTPSPSSATPSPKKGAPHYDVYLALIQQWKYDPEKVTKQVKGQFMGVASELHKVGITPERIPDVYAYISQRAQKERWNGWTVSVLPKYANDFLVACPVPSTPVDNAEAKPTTSAFRPKEG